MFGFLKGMFGKEKYRLGMSRKKEVAFCEALGKNIREYKQSHYSEITWEKAIEMYVSEATSSHEEYDRLLTLMNFFIEPEDRRLDNIEHCYKSVFPSKFRIKKGEILSKNIDKYYKTSSEKIKENYKDIITNYGDQQYTQLLELPNRYDFKEIFKDWVKKADIRDEELKNILYYAESNKILIKKKEKNRLYYKFNDFDISESMKNIALGIYLEEYNEIKKMAMYAVDMILMDIEDEGGDNLVYNVTKSHKFKSNKYDWIMENDFFGIGKKRNISCKRGSVYL